MIKPIKPEEVVGVIPDEVIMAFNKLIANHWNGKEATILQKDAVKETLNNFKNSGKKMTEDKLFEMNYLDVEGLYQNQGWKVDFDKPAYNETYEAYFVFRK